MFLSPMDSFSVVPMCLSFQLSWSKSLLAMDRFDFFMERFSVRHGADACLTASFQKFTASFPNLTAAFCELTAAFFRWSASPFALFALSCRNTLFSRQNDNRLKGVSPRVLPFDNHLYLLSLHATLLDTCSANYIIFPSLLRGATSRTTT